MFYYRSNEKQKHEYYKCHFLGTCLAKAVESKRVENCRLYGLSLCFDNYDYDIKCKVKDYYHVNENDRNLWIDSVNKISLLKQKTFINQVKLENLLKSTSADITTSNQLTFQPTTKVIHLKRKLLTTDDLEVKVIRKSTQFAYEAYRSEVDMLKDVKNENIFNLIDYYESSECYYIIKENNGREDYGTLESVMKYLKSQNLKLIDEITSEITKQIVSALNYLKSFGISHNNLSESNILVHLISNKMSESLTVKIKLVNFTFPPNNSYKPISNTELPLTTANPEKLPHIVESLLLNTLESNNNDLNTLQHITKKDLDKYCLNNNEYDLFSLILILLPMLDLTTQDKRDIICIIIHDILINCDSEYIHDVLRLSLTKRKDFKIELEEEKEFLVDDVRD